MGNKIRVNKNKVEIIKSFEEYKMKSRVRDLEKKVNKIWKFGLTFWTILGAIILFFVLMTVM